MMSDENKEKVILVEMKVSINLQDTGLIVPFDVIGTADGEIIATDEGDYIGVSGG